MNPIDRFLSQLPPHKAALVSYLRDCVHAASPNITERIAYGVPFFDCGRPLCYFICKPKGCDVGFLAGSELVKHPALRKKKRKLVRSLFFTWDEDVDVELLQQILAECLALPRYAAKKR